MDGRKQPLIEIMERTLRNQEEYMRHTSDEEYRNMPVQNVTRRLKTLNEYDEEERVENMRADLQAVERTRHIKVWHDLSTIANHGHLVFMDHVHMTLPYTSQRMSITIRAIPLLIYSQWSKNQGST